MTKRVQTIILGIFILIFISGLGYIIGNAFINNIDRNPDSNKFIKVISHYKSKDMSLFMIRWKQKMSEQDVLNYGKYYIEQVEKKNGKWSPLKTQKKIQMIGIQHSKDPNDKTGVKKVTLLKTKISPREKKDEYYRIFARDIVSFKGEVMPEEEYGVIRVSF